MFGTKSFESVKWFRKKSNRVVQIQASCTCHEVRMDLENVHENQKPKEQCRERQPASNLHKPNTQPLRRKGAIRRKTLPNEEKMRPRHYRGTQASSGGWLHRESQDWSCHRPAVELPTRRMACHDAQATSGHIDARRRMAYSMHGQRLLQLWRGASQIMITTLPICLYLLFFVLSFQVLRLSHF